MEQRGTHVNRDQHPEKLRTQKLAVHKIQAYLELLPGRIDRRRDPGEQARITELRNAQIFRVTVGPKISCDGHDDHKNLKRSMRDPRPEMLIPFAGWRRR